MKNIFRLPSAQTLSLVAFGLWFCSLWLIVFVFDGRLDPYRGYHILQMGWLGPLDGNFAWYANILFLVAVPSLWMRRVTATKSAIVATILSLNTCSFDYIPTGGGGKDTIYGYGWGCSLWFAAIFLVLVAAGKRLSEIGEEGDEILIKLGGVSLMILVVSFSYYAVDDRWDAIGMERTRLESVIFKRG